MLINFTINRELELEKAETEWQLQNNPIYD